MRFEVDGSGCLNIMFGKYKGFDIEATRNGSGICLFAYNEELDEIIRGYAEDSFIREKEGVSVGAFSVKAQIALRGIKNEIDEWIKEHRYVVRAGYFLREPCPFYYSDTIENAKVVYDGLSEDDSPYFKVILQEFGEDGILYTVKYFERNPEIRKEDADSEEYNAEIY